MVLLCNILIDSIKSDHVFFKSNFNDIMHLYSFNNHFSTKKI